jgi:hypothetical protein
LWKKKQNKPSKNPPFAVWNDAILEAKSLALLMGYPTIPATRIPNKFCIWWIHKLQKDPDIFQKNI